MKINFLFALLFFSILLHAQVEDNWDIISDFERNYKTYVNDTSVNAVYLLHNGSMSYIKEKGNIDRRVKFIHNRIKILRKSGLDEADITISYKHNGGSEELKDLKYQIINTDGTRYVLSNKDFIVTKVNENYSKISISPPNVQIGSIIEYSYKRILAPNYYSTKNIWYFQLHKPVLKGEFIYAKSDHYDHAVSIDPGLKMNKIIKKQNNLDSLKNSIDTIKYKNKDFVLEVYNLTHFYCKNALAISEEPYTKNLYDYRAKVLFLLNSYKTSGNQKPIKTFFDWKSISKILMEDEDFGIRFKSKLNVQSLNRDVSKLLNKSMSNEEKIKSIYRFLQDKMIWNNKFSKYAFKSLNKLYKEGVASSGAINLMFIGLCKAQKIDVSPILISTTDYGRVNINISKRWQFNHVLAMVKFNGVDILIDVSDQYHPIELIRLESCNELGFNVDNQKWVNINHFTSYEKINANVQVGTDIISYKLRVKETGYFASEYREYLASDEKEEYWSTNISDDYDINSIELKNRKDLSKAMVSTITLEKDIEGENLSLLPIISLKWDENPFLEKRNLPVDLNFPFIYDYSVSLNISDEYEIRSIPTSINQELNNKDVTLQYIVKQKGNLLQCRLVFSVTKTHYELHEYEDLKNIFEALISSTNDPIILTRKK